jgi:hypothetical protein
MTGRRSQGIAALLVPAALALAGCAPAAAGGTGTAAVEQPATLRTPAGGGPGLVTLTETAAKRLGIRTAPVATAGSRLTIPYGAVIYEPNGSAWAFVETTARTYQRAPITIIGILGATVTLSTGPKAGTAVVTQGAAELVGVETGIDGEE